MAHTTSLHETLTPSHELPPQTAIPGTARHEPVDETAREANAVNSVQHALRAAVSKKGLDAAHTAVERFGSYERDTLLPDINAIRAEFSDADQYVRSVTDTHLQRIEDELDEREAWYRNLVRGEWGHSITDIADRARDLRHTASSLEIITVKATASSPEHPDATATIPAGELTTPLSEFGFDAPHTFLAVHNSDKGSRYPFIPWYGTVVCTCPFKQNNPHMPCCKHELFAATVDDARHGASHLRKLPTPYTRLVSPLGRRYYRDLLG